MEKRTFFNNKKLNGLELINKKSKVAKEITNFMDKRRNSMFQFGLKKPSMYNFAQKRRSRRERGLGRNSMDRMHRMMRSSMFDINFK